MNKKQAVSIIKEVFGSAFNRDSFISFSVNLLNLNQIDLINKNINIFDAYKQHVESLELVANFSDGKNEIDVLIVKLFKDTSLDKARTMQRNFVARYLDNKQSDAALVAFTSPNAQDWRFSLIKMDYKFKNTDTGIKIEQELTPAKRWSFLVGKNENSHTAQSQLIDILLDDNNSPKLPELEQAFSIETVTNEFFNKYTDLFLRMKQELDLLLEKDYQLKTEFKNKDIDTADFAKKTMGQMAFIYFLQKKGWFGVAPGKDWGAGVKNFLREIFEHREKYGKNFFDDVLEPLFYEALAQDRGNEAIYPKLNNCRMPFLNGGLFEPMNGYSWETTHILLSDELFSNQEKTKEGDVGDGILDVFDRYNFTVNEADPLEQEVAVDPEMLGKVFENLLEIKDRKGKGAFYTPREIVHYMCQESLVNYLEAETSGSIPKPDIELFIRQGSQIIQNDKSIVEQDGDKDALLLPESVRLQAEELDNLLADIKVCDPAVGSGAFPLGMLNEIVTARTLTGVYLQNDLTVYDLKLHAISNSIYGVDIDPGAVEIAKLRFWLSLVVEEEEPTPLPNLEHKIMQGNSLVSRYEGIELFDDDFLKSSKSVNDEKVEIEKKLESIQKEYFSLHGSGELTAVKKAEFDKEIRSLQRRLKFLDNKGSISRETGGLFNVNQAKEKAQHKAKGLQAKIAEYVTEDRKTHKENLKNEIDNLKWDLIEATLESRDEVDKLSEIKKLRKNRVKPFFIWKLEFGEVFKDDGGFDVVVGNPPYIQLQKAITEESNIKHGNLYEDCGYETFKRIGDIYALFYELGVDILRQGGHLAYITSNKWMRAGYGDLLRRFFSRNNPKILIDFGGFKIFENATVDVNILLIQKKNNDNLLMASHFENDYQKGYGIANYFDNKKVCLYDLGADIWFIGDDNQFALKKKVEKIGMPLKKWNLKISYGIKTGYNKAFIVDKDKRDELIETDKNSNEIIKPILRGKDIRRYGYVFSDLYVIVAKYNSNKYLSDKYPAVYGHLLSHKKKLSERGQCTNRDGKGQHHWLELDNNPTDSYLSRFTGEKIMYSEIVQSPQFFYDAEGAFFAEATCFVVTGENLKILSAIFHSKVFTYLFSNFYAGGGLGGSGYRYKKAFIENVPVPPVLNDNLHLAKKIESLVDQRLTNPDDSKEVEAQIDRLVYQLYDLTDDEISIIERNS